MSYRATSCPSIRSIHAIPVDGNSGCSGIQDYDGIQDGDFLPNGERPYQLMQSAA